MAVEARSGGGSLMSNHNSSFGLSLAPTTGTAGNWQRRRLVAAGGACEKLLQSSCPLVRPLLRSLKPRIFIFSLSSCCTIFFGIHISYILLLSNKIRKMQNEHLVKKAFMGWRYHQPTKASLHLVIIFQSLI